METLVVVDQHKNQYYTTRSKSQGHVPFGYSSSPSKDFRGINCRTFQSGLGILPTPLKSQGTPKTPPSSPSPSHTHAYFSSPDGGNKLNGKIGSKSNPIPINGKGCRKERIFSDNVSDGSLSLSELWAGPTYSNSPPPSSLPIPKFSVRPKRTVSLDLPDSSSPEVEMRLMAKSAPASPSREHSPSTRGSSLFVNADSATMTLRRILNLNINDE